MTAAATRPRADSAPAPLDTLLSAWSAMWTTALEGYKAWAMASPWSLMAWPTAQSRHDFIPAVNKQRDPWVMRAHNRTKSPRRTRIKHHEHGCPGNLHWEPREETDPGWLESAAHCKQCAKMKRVRAA